MTSGKSTKALMLLLLSGVLMGALDLAIIGPALPAIQSQFGMTTRELAWLFNLYVLGQLIGTPLLAKLSDRFGTRPIYISSILLFAAGSVLVIIGPNPSWLFVGRAIQGFGGGGIFPVAVKVIGDTFPPEKRGGALGLLGMVFGIAFLIGPILGGLLLDFGWQWLFLINIPIAVALIAGAWQLLPPGNKASLNKPFDRAGALTLTVALASLAIAITNFDSSTPIASLITVQVWPFLIAFLILAPWCWQLEKRAIDPIIKPAFLANRQIAMASCITLGLGAMQSGTAFYPVLAVMALGLTEANAAWLLLPGLVCTTIASPTAGLLINRVGSRTLIVLGLTLIAIGFLLFGMTELTVTWFIVAGCIAGFGFASALGAPVRVIVLNEVAPSDRGAAQGLLNVSINIGQLLGAALVGGIAASMGGGGAGYQAAFAVLGCITAGLLIFALRLRNRAAEHRSAGQSEQSTEALTADSS